MKALKAIPAVAIGVLAVGVALASWAVSRPRTKPSVPTPISPVASAAPVTATFVGRTACAECHKAEDDLWKGSHHDLAMQDANASTVLGDFNDASFTYHDVTTTFSRQGEAFRVRTDGPDGKLHDFTIAYTFGIYPLQQYLIAFPGGRNQALNVCWDARPKDQGGQRWFHLYPDENVTADDILHWTGPYQNWNHMCAECHSTAVHKNYDAATDSFKTSWTEIDVSCEACHGPGSEHVAWARRVSSAGDKAIGSNDAKGLVSLLREERAANWLLDPTTGIAKRDRPRTSHAEINTCARCHARRGTFNEDVLPGRHPADTHRLALLEPALYEADGQIKDEVYEYGSFLQSKMHAAGVTCSDCHNPHSLKAPPGNAACAKCHAPEKFDTPDHHFHAAGTKGSACVDCHMPTRNYMVVHARHDHSMRVPRPDLTESIGTPNACNGCHADKSAQWAADEIARRTPGKPLRPHFAEALAAGRRGLPTSDALLAKLLGDTAQPAIARASAADMLAGAQDQSPLIAALADADPIIRSAAVGALRPSEPAEFISRVAPLLNDPIRQVRIDAGRRLAAEPDAVLSPEQRAARGKALDEFIAAQTLDADRAEGRLNLGAMEAERGNTDAALREYLAAIKLSPRFPATYVNLGDLYRELGREDDALQILREGLSKATDNADIPHALGLALVRKAQLNEALPHLKTAALRAPDNTRYAYVYAVALESVGPPGSGIDVLKQAHERRPNDADILSALIAYCRGAARLNEAVQYAETLDALQPNDPQVRAILEQLKSERATAGQ